MSIKFYLFTQIVSARPVQTDLANFRSGSMNSCALLGTRWSMSEPALSCARRERYEQVMLTGLGH